MTIRFGVSPIAWINDDMPELGGDTSLESLLADVRDVGFAGVELGGKFPKDPAVLKPLLDGYGLELVGGWYSGELLVRDVEAEIAACQAHLSLLKAMDCSVFVHAETSNAIHGNRAVPLNGTPQLEEAGWSLFTSRVTEFADYIEGEGLRFAYHHHLGTVVERPEDIVEFIRRTGASVGLTLDTGHAMLGGTDPVQVLRQHPNRIAHVHCKDVRGSVFRRVRKEGMSFLDGVLAGMFTVPGDGDIDFAEVMRALADNAYEGWIIIEAEQDPAKADPREYAELGLATIERDALKAGLRKAA